MKSLNTVFNDTDGNGRITLYTNPFGNGSQYYGKFERNTITTETLIARIQKKKAGTNELAVQQIAGFLKQEILEALEKGEAVNLLDLGTMYIVPNGKFNGTTLQNGTKPTFGVRFTPSQQTQSTVENLQIKDIRIAEVSPVINKITDMFTSGSDNNLSAGKSVLLEGQRLKVSGQGSGVFLCPVYEDNTVETDESQFINCPVITKNTNKNLEFYIPDDTEGTYCILVKTYYSSNVSNSKNAKTVLSEQVVIS